MVGLLALLSALLFACASPSEQSGWRLYRLGFYQDALTEWRKAAQNNDGGAAFRLGAALLDGVVTKKNPSRAVFWFEKGAQLGEKRSLYELGSLYDQGLAGLKPSAQEAARYYLAAARQNLPQAQYNIATMYEKGDGVDKNLPRAFLFYQLAIANGFHILARPAFNELKAQMSRGQIALGEILLEQFKADPYSEI